jgi:hypothetical protein
LMASVINAAPVYHEYVGFQQPRLSRLMASVINAAPVGIFVKFYVLLKAR